jgi:hypothetical protein
MKSLLVLILILLIIFLIVREVPRTITPLGEVNPGWATMRYDAPWYGERHFKTP